MLSSTIKYGAECIEYLPIPIRPENPIHACLEVLTKTLRLNIYGAIFVKSHVGLSRI